MADRKIGWQHLARLLAGLAVGVVCLIAWSSTSSAADLGGAVSQAPATDEARSGGRLGALVERVVMPVNEVLAPTGVDLSPLTEQVVEPTLGGLGTTVREVAAPILAPLAPDTGTPSLPLPLPLPEAPEIPTIGPLPTVELPGTVGAPAPAPAPTGPALADGPLAHLDGGPSSGVVVGDPADPIATALLRDATAADPSGTAAMIGHDEQPSAPLAPWAVPFAPVLALGSMTAGSTPSGTAGLMLLGVLVGVGATAAASPWRRLHLPGQRQPAQPVAAIVTPPG